MMFFQRFLIRCLRGSLLTNMPFFFFFFLSLRVGKARAHRVPSRAGGVDAFIHHILHIRRSDQACLCRDSTRVGGPGTVVTLMPRKMLSSRFGRIYSVRWDTPLAMVMVHGYIIWFVAWLLRCTFPSLKSTFWISVLVYME